ncbi:MAG TPA: methyltransferase domain-containing protein [Acidimicrobiia bacterium]|nr:methyltransferase domain-containing protein [Acidimicrobiia bacterium]
MSDCCNPRGYQDFFDEKQARRSLRRYDKSGLDPMARSMVDYLVSRGVDGSTVLEAGGGIGAIQVELLKAGAARSVNVELSESYERTASRLLAREGLGDRVDRRVGDFTQVAPGLEADAVVMNRVICCYPFMERLVATGLGSARRFLAATFPRDRLAARAAMSIGNLYCKVTGVDFRSYMHPPEEIVATSRSDGFEPVHQDRDFIWNAVVFERAG